MEKTHWHDMRAGEGECLRSVHALWAHHPSKTPMCLQVWKLTLSHCSKASKELSLLPLLPSLEVSWWVENSYLLITCLFGEHPVSPHLHKLR